MDPLSIVASSIAVGQAAGAAGKFVKFLYSLKNIPDDFLAFRNRLKALEDELKFLEKALKEREDGVSDSGFDLTFVRKQADILKEDGQELSSIHEELKKHTKGLTKGGKLKASTTL